MPKDTDFTATLTDLEPMEKRLLLRGNRKSQNSARHGKPQIYGSREIYKFEIDMWNTSNSFIKGHRIRIEISSSNFPRYNRNLNSGNPIASDIDITNFKPDRVSRHSIPFQNQPTRDTKEIKHANFTTVLPTYIWSPPITRCDDSDAGRRSTSD
ncbi:MAG: hypothetical protein Ct9H300mP19_18310 [Dehalococcoidia bacterium]|nr:MAG: hypothetical protein Ct9H300mP19_18310 [Dehalococcoidia bacterium]